ncbi:MAG TPA: hypothetical protein PK329_00870, partial [Myxococcota bacterium]|nr:hypothetical protein [Myxococcota bacterium]HON24747.1 hypothetical protein [Myxococcota bacterium]HOS62138.1 hypothetical protein [Myxococcota bacterium]HPC91948.1 hypothetical protein [Myxococcota bacterium]HPL24869.1 hypothetical protein [Myxococcota bacterium]
DFGPGRMPPDMFLNCNEEEKRHKERTIRNQNMLTSTIRSRARDRARLRSWAKVPLWQFGPHIV